MNQPELAELESAIQAIWSIAQRFGLDPYPIAFELVPASIMYEFGAYGLPGRFSHWTHGRAYQQIKTEYDYGLSRIYELVVNTNPAYAFLLENNSVLQNKLIAAHVLAHVDFFKHNAYFQSTNRQMIETASRHAERLRRHEYDHGQAEVERFLDAVLSIQDHVDPYTAGRRPDETPLPPKRPTRAQSGYDDLFELGEPKPPAATPEEARDPLEPDGDLLRFIGERARQLTDWQRDVLEIVRSEQLYFVPQMRTKVMNEGWATFWHLRIMRELELSTEDYVNFANMHAGVITPSRGQINPYYVGLHLLEDVERRWDEPTAEERERFGRRPGEGRAKLFEIREEESDASFFRNYLTRELVDELDLYLYRLEGNRWVIVDKDWEKVRDTLVASVTHYGRPTIVVEDGDYRKNGELFLRHCDEGQPLDLPDAEKTLANVYRLWGRPVHLETVKKAERVVLSFDGTKHATRPMQMRV
jgi:stage V sporulation protein R